VFFVCLFVCFVFKSALNASSVVKRIHSGHQNQDEEETVDSAYTVRQVLNPNSRKEKQISAKSLVLSKTAFFPLTKDLSIIGKCVLRRDLWKSSTHAPCSEES